ncbi:unnamed protein product [Protopolystoma xenopodis]|uniref:Uncharacterized protein n=1 Tax=Protopolystoma xenopodis TaxID=117903 RepID=A0A448WWK2_9PLAT|nr:unnamed protein product [Protopolystoma xenopodis]
MARIHIIAAQLLYRLPLRLHLVFFTPGRTYDQLGRRGAGGRRFITLGLKESPETLHSHSSSLPHATLPNPSSAATQQTPHRALPTGKPELERNCKYPLVQAIMSSLLSLLPFRVKVLDEEIRKSFLPEA